jgi:hypothetical protein
MLAVDDDVNEASPADDGRRSTGMTTTNQAQRMLAVDNDVDE